MKSIDRYMARLIAVPLFSTLVIAAMLLVLDRMLRLFDFVATEGGPVSVVWQMLANLLPEYFGLGIPIGLMLGCLLAFRRLATSSELDVLRAVGISYNRLLRVPYMYAVVLAMLNFAIVGYVQPKARYPLRAAALRTAHRRARRVDQGRRVHHLSQWRPHASASSRAATRAASCRHFPPADRQEGQHARGHRGAGQVLRAPTIPTRSSFS